MRTVTVSDFPQCCGIKILHSFYKRERFEEFYSSVKEVEYHINTNISNAKYYISRDSIREAIRYLELVESVRDYLKYPDEDGSVTQWVERIEGEVQKLIKSYWRSKVGFIAVLNSDEIELEPVLLKLGFTILVPNTINPSGTCITTYWFDLNPKNTEKTKSVFDTSTIGEDEENEY